MKQRKKFIYLHEKNFKKGKPKLLSLSFPEQLNLKNISTNRKVTSQNIKYLLNELNKEPELKKRYLFLYDQQPNNLSLAEYYFIMREINKIGLTNQLTFDFYYKLDIHRMKNYD